tara:strand:- start:39 stop:233 length:195 start_codon:yes stop_codon:yes gene_type:complete
MKELLKNPSFWFRLVLPLWIFIVVPLIMNKCSKKLGRFGGHTFIWLVLGLLPVVFSTILMLFTI